MYDNRHYMIFSINEVDAVNFDHVLETSANTLRLSTNGAKTFVKWEGEMPECVSTLGTKEGPYSHSEILEILSGEDWTAPMEEI